MLSEYELSPMLEPLSEPRVGSVAFGGGLVATGDGQFELLLESGQPSLDGRDEPCWFCSTPVGLGPTRFDEAVSGPDCYLRGNNLRCLDLEVEASELTDGCRASLAVPRRAQ